MWGSNESKCAIGSFFFENFSSSQIYQKHFAIKVNNRIFRLYVSVDDIVLMKMLNCQQETAKEISSNFSVNKRQFPNHIEHFLSLNILHQKVNVLLVMEGLGESNDVGEDYF
jgi:hypothetical protein